MEVPIGTPGDTGNWPTGSKTRRLDGVRVAVDNAQEAGLLWFGDHREEFSEDVSCRAAELIEAKTKLNRLVIGQVVAGVDMFERQYDRELNDAVIVCGEGDPALEWVCGKRGIRVEVIPSRP